MKLSVNASLLAVCGTMMWAQQSNAAVASAMTMQFDSGWDTAVNNYRKRMTANGANVGAKDMTIFWSEIADPKTCINGTCGEDQINDNLDYRDAMFLGTHGTIDWGPAGATHCTAFGPNWYGQLTTTSGNPNGDAFVRSTEMRLGDHQLEFLDLFSCQSNIFHFSGNWLARTNGLHQLHGFQGTMAFGDSLTAGRVDDYVDDAFDGSAAYAWVENQTGKTYSVSDSCGTSLTVGDNADDAAYRQDVETYSTNFSDPRGQAGWYLWKCPCNPPGTECDFAGLGMC